MSAGNTLENNDFSSGLNIGSKLQKYRRCQAASRQMLSMPALLPLNRADYAQILVVTNCQLGQIIESSHSN